MPCRLPTQIIAVVTLKFLAQYLPEATSMHSQLRELHDHGYLSLIAAMIAILMSIFTALLRMH
jgi:hypothetical protein